MQTTPNTATVRSLSHEDWRFVDRIHSGMFAVAQVLAEDVGYLSGIEGRELVTTDADVQLAVQLPVSMAAVFADLCAHLGIETPDWIDSVAGPLVTVAQAA